MNNVEQEPVPEAPSLLMGVAGSWWRLLLAGIYFHFPHCMQGWKRQSHLLITGCWLVVVLLQCFLVHMQGFAPILKPNSLRRSTSA